MALPVGEVAREAAMAHFGRLTGGGVSPALAGKDPAGRPLTGQHLHAHYLSLDEDGDGRIDHLLVWAPGALGRLEVAACILIDELHDRSVPGTPARFDPVRVGAVAVGGSDSAPIPARVIGPAHVWRSVTPFVPPRHPKWRGSGEQRRLVDGPADQVLRELEHRGVVARVTGVEKLAAVGAWTAFRTGRRTKLTHRAAEPAGWQITFDRPVTGPVALGYGAHFGLGLFAPVGDGH